MIMPTVYRALSLSAPVDGVCRSARKKAPGIVVGKAPFRRINRRPIKDTVDRGGMLLSAQNRQRLDTLHPSNCQTMIAAAENEVAIFPRNDTWRCHQLSSRPMVDAPTGFPAISDRPKFTWSSIVRMAQSGVEFASVDSDHLVVRRVAKLARSTPIKS